jgi:hypothetical protein
VSEVLKQVYARADATSTRDLCAEKLNELMRDLGCAISSRREEYFLGTMVLEQRAAGSLKLRDGRKRLLTIAILLDALHSRLDGTKARRRKGIAREAAISIREFLDGLIEGLSGRARLTLLRRWRTFVERRVFVATATAPSEVFRRVVLPVSRQRALQSADEQAEQAT